MKRLLFLLSLLINTALVFSQNYVFVLVDISGSIKQPDLNGAKQALTDVLLGNPPANATIAYGNAQDLLACKIKSGDRLSILKFGNKATILGNTPSPNLIQNIPADVIQQINSFFPISLPDNKTYITLAKAKVAEYAKNNQIKEYKLYIITDSRNDDYGPNGKPDYTDWERSLVESYGTTSSGITQALSTKLKLFNAINKDYVLEFIPKIDISKYSLPNQPPITIDTANNISAAIKITSSPGGRKGKEIELKSDNINVNWTCSNYPQGGKYIVMISEYDGGKFREVKKDLNSGFNIKLPDGKYKITVSAQNFTASSDTTYIKINSSGFGWVIGLLIFGAIVGTGYYFWNKKRQQKIDMFSSNTNADDIFSKGGSTGNTAPNSSNSDYF